MLACVIPAPSRRRGRIEQRLQRGVWHRPYEVDGRGSELLQGLHHALALHDLAAIADDDAEHGPAVEMLGDEPFGGRWKKRECGCKFVGTVCYVVAVVAQDLTGLFQRMHEHSAHDDRPDGMQTELERRHDSEVAAATAQSPK